MGSASCGCPECVGAVSVWGGLSVWVLLVSGCCKCAGAASEWVL